MKPEAILILADALKEYYSDSELQDLCELFDIDLPYEDSKPAHLRFARTVLIQIEHGNNRRFLVTIIDPLLSRCQERIAHTNWERRNYHQRMEARLFELNKLIEESGIPAEITVPEDQPFTAKSKAREFLENTETDVFIVDAYIGIGTLDCLRDVKHRISILTGDKNNSIGQGFDTALKDFRSEGHEIEIRCHPKLHDRYIVFNERCWLVGSSFKDAGKKTFSVIELIDGKAPILAEIERKWAEAIQYNPYNP